jgi:cytochrome c-type biogenesis protein CcmH/NrfG
MPENVETENTETKNIGFVKKQTLVIWIVVSLFIGFVGGTIYTSFKLTADKPVEQQSIAVPNNNPAVGQPDNSVEVSAKILQVEQYLKQNPKDAEAWTQLGNLFFDSDQVKNAIDAYEKSLAIEPGKIGVITDIGVMYRRNGQPKKAVEAFDKAIAIDPSFETARFNKGIVLLHDLNDIEGGIKAWEQILEINPMAMAPNGDSVDALVQRMKKQK